MAALLPNRCRFCDGPLVAPEGVAMTVCEWCRRAPERVAMRTRHHDAYCATVHEGFAAAARARGDLETAQARERRAAELR